MDTYQEKNSKSLLSVYRVSKKMCEAMNSLIIDKLKLYQTYSKIIKNVYICQIFMIKMLRIYGSEAS